MATIANQSNQSSFEYGDFTYTVRINFRPLKDSEKKNGGFKKLQLAGGALNGTRKKGYLLYSSVNPENKETGELDTLSIYRWEKKAVIPEATRQSLMLLDEATQKMMLANFPVEWMKVPVSREEWLFIANSLFGDQEVAISRLYFQVPSNIANEMISQSKGSIEVTFNLNEYNLGKQETFAGRVTQQVWINSQCDYRILGTQAMSPKRLADKDILSVLQAARNEIKPESKDGFLTQDDIHNQDEMAYLKSDRLKLGKKGHQVHLRYLQKYAEEPTHVIFNKAMTNLMALVLEPKSPFTRNSLVSNLQELGIQVDLGQYSPQLTPQPSKEETPVEAPTSAGEEIELDVENLI